MKKDIESRMLALRNDGQVAGLSRFFKTGKGQYGEGDLFLGIKVPQIREVVKDVWRDCQLEDLEVLVTSSYHELRMCGLLILVELFTHARKQPLLRQECVEYYLSHTRFINNWDLVDLSCPNILGTWLLDKDRTLLYDLARNGRTLWEQRISIVTCLQLIRHGEYDDTLRIADLLLHHPHDLIHKAVGWMLREVGKRDEALLYNYLCTPASGEPHIRCQVMPRTALRYAIEKLPEPVRCQMLAGKVN